MKNWRAVNLFTIRVSAMIMMILITQGCSVFMAAKQPPKKNMNVLSAGTSRATVIAELGQPILTEINPDGNKVDIFKFVQGYSKGVKASRALFHGVADFFTLGLWEVIGTPAESIANGTEVKVQVTYDANGRVLEISGLQD